MSKRQKPYLMCVDTEWTCWNDREVANKSISEIIEFGICITDIENKQIIDSASHIVKPQYSELSDYCIQLTGITPKQAKQGIVMQDMTKHLMRLYGTKRMIWAGWGNENQSIQQWCDYVGAMNPFSDHYINIADVMNLKFASQITSKLSLQQACAFLNIQQVLPWHRGVNDAITTAKIAMEIL